MGEWNEERTRMDASMVGENCMVITQVNVS
jgi:hypothetical protein